DSLTAKDELAKSASCTYQKSMNLWWHKCNIGFRLRQRLGTSRVFYTSVANWKRPVSNPFPLCIFREVWFPARLKPFPNVNQNPSAASRVFYFRNSAGL
ncbi:MAG: hypothetical protein M0T74_04135, partial [Desulfitobacterium hafniense]|nr:hypothetical protein [Desulfitobacterium hafniense]